TRNLAPFASGPGNSLKPRARPWPTPPTLRRWHQYTQRELVESVEVRQHASKQVALTECREIKRRQSQCSGEEVHPQSGQPRERGAMGCHTLAVACEDTGQGNCADTTAGQEQRTGKTASSRRQSSPG